MGQIIPEEALLALAVKNSGGGGGGTSNYNELNNKPQINDVTLSGNKSLADLGIASASDLQQVAGSIPDELSDLTEDSTHRTVTDAEKTTWGGKQDTLTFDDAPTASSNNPVKSGGIYTALSSKQNNLGATKDANNDVTFLGNVIDGEGNVLSEVSALEQSASGNPIIVNAQGIDAKELSVELEPIQDLHGYDKPWAGGAGKNKIPMTLTDIKAFNTAGTWNGNTYTQYDVSVEVIVDNADNVIGFKANSTGASASLDFILYNVVSGFDASAFNGDIINGSIGGSNSTYYVRISDVTTATSQSDDGDVTIANLTNSGKVKIFIGFKTGVVVTNQMFYPMIRNSGESAAFAPYSNICPISGRTETSVWADSKHKAPIWWNQLAGQNARSVTDASVTITWDSTNKKYSISGTGDQTTGTWLDKMSLVSGHKVLARCSNSKVKIYFNNSANAEQNVIATSIDGQNYVGILIENGKVYNDDFTINVHDLTALFGATEADYIYSLEQATAGAGVAYFRNLFPKDYYAYNAGEETCVGAVNGEPYGHATISFGQTVYGARINFKTGEGIVDEVIKTLTAATHINKISNTNWYVDIDTTIKRDTDTPCISNKFKKWDGTESQYGGGICFVNTNGAIRFNTVQEYSTVEEMFAAIGNLEFCCKLATPFTIQLTPSVLKLLEGYNYITGDGEMELTYVPESISGYMEEVLVPISLLGTNESGRTIASRAYTTGEYFYQNGKMYKATTSIASGATFTVGTNCTQTTLFAELKAAQN